MKSGAGGKAAAPTAKIEVTDPDQEGESFGDTAQPLGLLFNKIL